MGGVPRAPLVSAQSGRRWRMPRAASSTVGAILFQDRLGTWACLIEVDHRRSNTVFNRRYAVVTRPLSGVYQARPILSACREELRARPNGLKVNRSHLARAGWQSPDAHSPWRPWRLAQPGTKSGPCGSILNDFECAQCHPCFQHLDRVWHVFEKLPNA